MAGVLAMSPRPLQVIDPFDRRSVAPSVESFLRDLGSPTLLRVPGRDPSRSRVVSTLLHGNEPSGPRAVHRWLRGTDQPAVDTWFFLGAVEAALAAPGFAFRTLPGARDLNRCFLPPHEGVEGAVAEAVLERIRTIAPEALIDLHNNTGHNPPYGVGPRDGPAELNLVGFFARRHVHSDLRLGAIVEATQAVAPSVTVECGRAGDPTADAIAYDGLARLLARDPLETRRLEGGGFELLRDPVRVCVKPGLRLAFGDAPRADAEFTVHADIDRHNFEELPPGTRIGWTGGTWPLVARDAAGREVSREWFARRGDALETRCALVPIMMTIDPGIALMDCLFYAVTRAPELVGR